MCYVSVWCPLNVGDYIPEAQGKRVSLHLNWQVEVGIGPSFLSQVDNILVLLRERPRTFCSSCLCTQPASSSLVPSGQSEMC